MDASDITTIFQNLEENAVAGFAVIAYYLLVSWTRIRDGLGLQRSKASDFDKEKQHIELLTAKIELETLKQQSPLDEETIASLEKETRQQLSPQMASTFTTPQKFIAIPLMIVVTLMSLLALNDLDPQSDITAIDILADYFFLLLMIIMGFWGIAHIRHIQSQKLKTSAYIVFWFLLLYIGLYFLGHTLANITQLPLNSDQAISSYVIIALISSIILGLCKKLPGMG